MFAGSRPCGRRRQPSSPSPARLPHAPVGAGWGAGACPQRLGAGLDLSHPRRVQAEAQDRRSHETWNFEISLALLTPSTSSDSTMTTVASLGNTQDVCSGTKKEGNAHPRSCSRRSLGMPWSASSPAGCGREENGSTGKILAQRKTLPKFSC